jgi:hypothetical protein
MPSSNVQSLDALKEAKAALARFAEDAGALLANVDADVARMGQWITHERPSHWKQQVRKREEAVQAARQEISRKIMAASPEPASTVLERKLLAKAVEKLEEAEKRRANTRRWAGTWDKESLMARGSISQLADFIRADIPQAIAKIDRMMIQLEQYLSITAPSADLTQSPDSRTSEIGSESSMARPIDERPPAQTFEHLRPFAADAISRAKPAPGGVDWASFALDPLDDQTQLDIAGLSVAGGTPDPAQTIVVAENALNRPIVWFLKGRPVDESDSGWYLGPLDNPAATGPCWRVPLKGLLEARPDLQSLVGTGLGTLAVVGPGGPIAIIDPAARNVWLADG